MVSENPPSEQNQEKRELSEPRNGRAKVRDAVGQHLEQLTSDRTPFVHDAPEDN